MAPEQAATITPPVGSGLSIGAANGQVKMDRSMVALPPFCAVIFAVLQLATYVHAPTMFLPHDFGM